MKSFLQNSSFKKTAFFASFLVIIFVLVGSSVVFASAPVAHSHKGNVPINGTIITINGTTLTVTTSGKTPTTYTVDASKAMVFGSKPETVANLTVGEKIHVNGAVTGTNVIAEGINVVPTMNIAHGTVSSISATSITLTVTSRYAKGQTSTATTQTFAITSKTKIMIPGTKSAAASNVVVGDEVMVMTMSDSSATPNALVINDMPLRVNKARTTNTAPKKISL